MGYRKISIEPEAFPLKIFNDAHEFYRAPEISFPDFIKKGWEILDPSNPLIMAWYIDLIAEYLTLVTEGKINKILINIGPRNGKSYLVTVLWPVWSWIMRPSLRWIFCSYSGSLSIKHSLDRRRVIESDWFQENWGGIVQLSTDQNQKQEYENTMRGHMIATSVGGTITGKGGDVIVEDDMLNPQEADSEAARKHSIGMHSHVLSNRLDNPKTGAKVIVEQRTHYKDVSGHVIKNEEGWTRLVLPLMFEKDTIIEFPISKRKILMKAGEFLNPVRHGQKEYDDAKRTMGTRAFVAQYQQNPTSEEGNILRRGWWKYWSGSVKDLGLQIQIQSWDMSFKKTEKGSYVVGQIWGKCGNRYYLLDQIRERMDFTDSLAAVVNLSVRWPLATAKLVEDKANGSAIMAVLKKKITGIVEIQPIGGKLSRAQSVAPLAEAGNVYLPDLLLPGNAWVADFIEECAAFTGANGEINDQVDGFSQALTRLREYDDTKVEEEETSFVEEEEYNMQSVGGFSG